MSSQDTLGSALEAFIREHEYCGDLDTGARGRGPVPTPSASEPLRSGVVPDRRRASIN